MWAKADTSFQQGRNSFGKIYGYGNNRYGGYNRYGYHSGYGKGGYGYGYGGGYGYGYGYGYGRDPYVEEASQEMPEQPRESR